MSVTALIQTQGEATNLKLHTANQAAIQGHRIRSPTKPQNVTRRQRVGVSAAFLLPRSRRGMEPTEKKMTTSKASVKPMEFKVALVRKEEFEDGISDTKRVLAVFTTYAKSEKQAINNVRFRNGGWKNLAYVGGGSHVLYDDYEIYKEGK